MSQNGNVTLETLTDKVVGASSREPRTGADLALRTRTGLSGRGIGRALGRAVAEGRLVKHPTRVPTYTKVR